MRLPIVAVVVLFFVPTAARAQGRCVHETNEDGALVFLDEFRFDAEGRVSELGYMNDPAAFSTRTRYRYARGGRLEGAEVNVLEGPTRVGLDPPIRVSFEPISGGVRERWESEQPLNNRVVRWSLDERERPARIEVDRDADGGTDDTWTCGFDILGRPVFMGHEWGNGNSSETRWLWSNGRLTRIERAYSSGGEDRIDVRRRRGRIELRVGREVRESYAGSCEQVLFGMCSPALGPGGAEGAVPRLPTWGRGRRRQSRTRARRVDFVPPATSGRVDLAALRRHYRGRTVFTSVTFGESDPSYPIPVVCVGARLGDCATRFHYDSEHLLQRIVSTDPRLRGPASLRVGLSYAQAEAHLERCRVERGPDEGIVCEVQGEPRVQVWLDGVGADPDPSDGPPSSAMRAAAHIVRLEFRVAD